MENKKYEPEINFKDLLKNPIRLFGWIYPLIVLLILVVGIFYVKHLDNIGKNTYSPLLTDSSFIKKDIDVEMKKGGIVPAVDLNLLSSPSVDFINKGKELFVANCSSCHGESGSGDGPAGAALNPKPRNFKAIDGWTNGRKISDMYKTLQEGIMKNGMAAYEYLPASDRLAIISYIRTFAKFPEVTADEISNLDVTYKLSEGTKIPNKIPVKLASELISDEFATEINGNLISKLNLDINQAQGLTDKVIDAIKIQKLLTIPDSVWNKNNLENIILQNPNSFGLKTSIVTLSDTEWDGLFNVLSKYKIN